VVNNHGGRFRPLKGPGCGRSLPIGLELHGGSSPWMIDPRRFHHPILGCPGTEVRINGLFHLLVNGGVKPLILTLKKVFLGHHT